jgi:Ni,Fe-hydrogenase III large subunit
MTGEWRLQEAATIAARVDSLQRTAIRLAESIRSVDLLDAPVVVDEIVAQLRPVDVGRMATELELATERIRQVVEAHTPPPEPASSAGAT